MIYYPKASTTSLGKVVVLWRDPNGGQVMQLEYLSHVVNLLDTPGHQDLSEDIYHVLTANGR